MNQTPMTSPSSSITTGLLTLSLHDSLTFDGVEVALHPELFSSYIVSQNNSNSSTSNGNVGLINTQQPTSNSASINSVMIGGSTGSGTHSRQHSKDSILSTPFGGGFNPTGGSSYHHSRDPSFNSVPQPPLTPNSSNNILPFHRREPSDFSMGNQSTENVKQNGIKPGDLIEIRVWEEKKMNKNSHDSHGRRKGLYHNPSNKKMQQQHTKTVIDRVSSKLQQHINQSSTSSIFHPLAGASSTTTPSSGVGEPFQSTSQNISKRPTSNAASSKPPIAPRVSSTASSAVASPMHTGPPPSLSPSPSHNQSNIQKLQFLPRWHNDSKDSIFRDDDGTEGNSSQNDVANNSSAEDFRLRLPFPVVSTEKLASGENSNMSSPKNGERSGTITPNMNFSGMDLSVSDDHEENLEQEEGVTPTTPETLTRQEGSGEHLENVVHKQREEGMIELISRTHVLKTKFVMGVTERSLKTLKSSGRTQISLLKKVASLYNLSSYDIVSVTKIDKSEEAAVLESVRADYVTLAIKDQFISRGEMHQFQEFFQGKWIYSGERLKTTDDMRGYVMDIRNKYEEIKSGFLTEETKITFRSRSARIFWLVQISSEMWDYASPYVEQGNGDGSCEIYFDKFVTFMKRLFDEWKALDATHSLTIIFFSRTYIKSKFLASSETRSMMTTAAEQSSIYRDTDGRLYEDFYKTIAENVTRSASWDSIIIDVKKAFVSYPMEVGWKVSRGNTYSRVPSTAAQGNILEAINTALNVMQLHYVDRDLYRCGNSVVVVSAGSGVFEVDKNLAAITKQRMMDNGIGSDMLSLGLPPLHVAPFFLYKETSNPSNDFDGWKAFFEIPHWMHLSFAAYDRPEKSKTNRNIDIAKHSQPPMQILANGFVVHNTDPDEHKNKDQQSQHLISDRDFEDILEACRPRNLEAASIGLPKALVAQMKIFGLIGKVETNKHHAYSEWGSVDFDAASNDSGKDDDERSKSSHSTHSHFTSVYSLALNNHSPRSQTVSTHSPSSPVQIQQSRSLETPHFFNNLEKLRNATREYDNNVFMSEAKSVIHSSSRGLMEPEKTLPSPIRPQNTSGGIGAAINQYENKHETKELEGLQPNTPQSSVSLGNEPTTITRVKRALVNPNLISLNQSLYMRPTSLTFVHEKPEDKMINSLDVTKHTVTYRSLTKPLEIPKSLSRSMYSDDNGTSRSFSKSGMAHLSLSPKNLLSISGSPTGRLGRVRLNVQGMNNRSQRESSPVSSHQYSRKKQWVLNPFRQEDEDEVLSKKDHNSRRWSHVFPQGEIEFKRQSGPNWRSLCQPAILPIQIDVFPTQEELDSKKYETRFYTLQLAALDNTYFKSHTDLLKEMLRQRLTQDYQQVPQAILESRSRISRDNAEKLRETYSSRKSSSSGSNNRDNNGSFKTRDDSERPFIALSMGHRIQTMTLNPKAVDIKIYTRRDASNKEKDATFPYNFKLWIHASKQYATVRQTFDKYQNEYKWNPLDLIISGYADLYLTEDSRNRSLSFRIIPDIFQNNEQETNYIKNIMPVILYLERLARKNLNIGINDEDTAGNSRTSKRNSEIRFKVNLRKGNDKYEWMEIVVDSSINTKRAFKIMFHWLVATSMKIEYQVKSLQRKAQKLNLVSAAYSSSGSNLYMHPLVRPECFKVRTSERAKLVEEALLNKFDFCDDGIIGVFPKDTFGVNCKTKNNGRRWATKYDAQQYINRAGTLFIRLLVDEDDSVLFVCLENRRHIGSDRNLLNSSRRLLQQIKDYANSVDI